MRAGAPSAISTWFGAMQLMWSMRGNHLDTGFYNMFFRLAYPGIWRLLTSFSAETNME
jgi:hypothetical protein